VDKARLAGRILDSSGTGGSPGFADRLAALFREAGVQLPEVTLEYRGLSVEADAMVGSAGQPTLGNAFKRVLKHATCQVGRGAFASNPELYCGALPLPWPRLPLACSV
jgi:hypothetical protein